MFSNWSGWLNKTPSNHCAWSHHEIWSCGKAPAVYFSLGFITSDESPPCLIWEFKLGFTEWLKQSHGLIHLTKICSSPPTKHQRTKLTKSLVSFTGPLESILTEITVLKFSRISWFSNHTNHLSSSLLHSFHHPFQPQGFAPLIHHKDLVEARTWAPWGTMLFHVRFHDISRVRIHLFHINLKLPEIESSSHLIVCNITLICHKCNLMLLVVSTSIDSHDTL